MLASAALCQSYNLNRGEGRSARAPADFDPWTKIDQRRARRDKAAWVDELTRAWVGEDGDGG